MSAQLDWLDLLETHRADYLATARVIARDLAARRGTITIDDVRDTCPPPSHIDPRVMGAVLKSKDFEPTGAYVRSRRSECHHRPVAVFRLRAG